MARYMPGLARVKPGTIKDATSVMLQVIGLCCGACRGSGWFRQWLSNNTLPTAYCRNVQFEFMCIVL